jgi:hypothetical protein
MFMVKGPCPSGIITLRRAVNTIREKGMSNEPKKDLSDSEIPMILTSSTSSLDETPMPS